MTFFRKHRLAIATTVYWVLLAYIVALLVWWFIALQTQNRRIADLRISKLNTESPTYRADLQKIHEEEKTGVTEFLGEGSTFLFLIVLGAMFVYREVRRQILLQLQQQNFMMAVTHELKTPIAVTKLNLETLQKYQLDRDQQQKLIQSGIQETNRLDILANNILVASQLEAGAYARAKEEVDLSLLVARVSQDFQRRFPERKWSEEVNPGCRLPGDPLLLQMLVSNLLENAFKYSPREGVVGIKLLKQTGQIILSVQDEGIGIPDGEKRKVFKKFYRAGEEKTRRSKGTGLGLYLCRKIADDHQASIKVSDHSPSGSIFTVTFPG
jgi:signal transduction histidine kinase